ncbi:Protein kinase domain-containing protein [Mycena sanguinolenta]|uniref:Protein kinase domain-containing protein n=1 Tax=Mycena sanguinolenta TaxID=230812 RepID=A0A8H7CKP1_9AGAR|nr:Protein kinase domain-containing protein [Mycena sanguinolenta]
MSLSIYDSLLTLITLTSWYLTLRKIYAIMEWEKPTDARNLSTHCSQYAIPKDEFSNLEMETSGNAFVICSAQYRKQRVILKRWHGAVVPNPSRVQFTKRLVRELDRWCTLEHPNISQPIGIALHISNLPALVVPAYRTVNQFLVEHPETDVLNLMHGVANALSYLHAQDPPIVHSDLKGSTVFISPSGAPLLCDIGIAAIPQPPDWGFHGVDDARWLAPELMDTALRPETHEGCMMDLMRTPDARLPTTMESDVFAFGMLSYEMHTRARPFATTPFAASVIVRIVSGQRPPRPDAEVSPQMTDALWDVIRFCWAQDWRARPQISAVDAWLGVLVRMRAVESLGNLGGGECCSSG